MRDAASSGKGQGCEEEASEVNPAAEVKTPLYSELSPSQTSFV
jgi:hypothetical protein